MGTGKVVAISLLVSIVIGFTNYWFVQTQNKKIGVVDAVKMFDQYNMKKELEGKAKIKLESMGKQMDSIKNLLNMAHATKNEEEEKKLAGLYQYFKNNLEQQYTQSNKDINEQVWKRLNAAIDVYGKKRGLHLIIGANGMGSVLYNDEYYDLTNDAIQFVNKKYEEGN